MSRTAIVACVLSGGIIQAACRCQNAPTRKDLKACLAGNPDAQECLADDKTNAQVVTCLEAKGQGGEWSWFKDTGSSKPASVSTNDVIEGVDILDEWFANQTWRTFVSDIGRPGSRAVKDVYLPYVTAYGNGTKGAIVLIGGNGEQVDDYDEVIYKFINMGYSPIYSYSHRGMGRSDRLLSDPFKAYVEKSTDHIEDLRKFVNLVADELKDQDIPLFLYCHSLGCGVSFTYLIQEYEAGRPQRFNAVVAQGPLVQVETAPWPYLVAVAVAEALVAFGQGTDYAPGNDKTFEAWYGTAACDTDYGSKARCLRIRERCAAKKDAAVGQDGHIGLCVGGATANQASELFDLYENIYKGFMAQTGKLLAPPILLQQSGDPAGSDKFVLNPPQDEFCTNSCKRCTMIKRPTAGHRIATERDSLFLDFMKDADEFYSTHSDVLLPHEPMPSDLALTGEHCNDDLDCVSRKCKADFVFDTFGGKCLASDDQASHAAPRCTGAALMVAAAAAMLALAV